MSYFSKILEMHEDYCRLVLSAENPFPSGKEGLVQRAIFIDKIKAFWFEHREMYRFAWNRIPLNQNCVVLSGATYLQCEKKSHYPLKAIGDLQFLPDPFLKQEMFFRLPKAVTDYDEVNLQFDKILTDTQKILKDLKNDFFFISQGTLAPETVSQRMDLISQKYEDFLFSAFKVPPTSMEEYHTRFSTFEAIEDGVSPHSRDLLLFTDHSDAELSIKERIHRFTQGQKLVNFQQGGPPASILLEKTLFCLFAQALDIVFLSFGLSAIPFLRSEIVLHYILLTMHSFRDEAQFDRFVRITICAYYFGQVIEFSDYSKIPFDDFKQLVSRGMPFKSIINQVDQISSQSVTGLSELRMLVERNFEDFIKRFPPA